MEEARSRARRRGRGWLPWGLLAGTVLVAGSGGWLAWRSLSALLARNAQLEREAAESEARVAELQVLRASMERRLRALERPSRQGAQPAAAATAPREEDAQLAGRETARKTLESRLKEELRRGDAWLDESDGRLRVELSERLLFEPGQPVLTQRGAEVLARVGKVLAPLTDHLTQVTDRTDESPTSGALLGSASPATGWELSAARAVAVARFLVEGARLAPERVSATGHASSRPGVTPDSRPFRLRTRRVELLLSPVPAPVSSARSAAPLPRAGTSASPRATREP